MSRSITIIGYSGHSYVAIDIFQGLDVKVNYYIDNEEKLYNPYKIAYLGTEVSESVKKHLKSHDYFIGIGDNTIRNKVANYLQSNGISKPINAIHTSVSLSSSVDLGSGIMCAPNVTINALAQVGNGVICNTGCIIEHECKIGAFAHICPGTVLAGNVIVGERTFIGANSVVKQGISIGKEVIIGAGSVVIRDIPNNVIVVGNPARIIKQNI